MAETAGVEPASHPFGQLLASNEVGFPMPNASRRVKILLGLHRRRDLDGLEYL